MGIKLAVGVVGGVVATFVGFLLNQRYQDDKEKIKNLKEYIATLYSAANELEFYTDKLKQLSGELDCLIEQLRHWRTEWIIPTYSIYPDFLEQCKITINRFHRNPTLVKDIGHCHFELCHILERLDLLKRQMYAPLPTDAAALTQQLQLHRVNANGFKGLVDANIPVFQAARESVLLQKEAMEKKLRIQRERSLCPGADDSA